MNTADSHRFGIYLHIPFCHARCGYCDFVTFTGKEAQIPRFTEALKREIAHHGRQDQWPALKYLESIFFGGGTPSLLEPSDISAILGSIGAHWSLNDAEITMEANPESISAEKAVGWRRAGINRMSLGLQSFNDTLLREMGRLHTADEFRRAYRHARDAGFDNLNIDLIYGFKDQPLSDWQETVTEAVRLAPEHLSVYALTIESHTPFAAAGYKTDNDLQASLYAWTREYLRDQGYDQYEVSNFAKSGYACRHNLLYWNQADYLGIGAGAVGCVNGKRWQVHRTLPAYFKSIDQGELPWESVEALGETTRKFERLMLGLRLRQGFEWGDELDARWRLERERLAQRGLLEETACGRWRIPDAAVALTNQVLLPFL
jgi:oxygen-independent coproporphyrinogen III oxidase